MESSEEGTIMEDVDPESLQYSLCKHLSNHWRYVPIQNFERTGLKFESPYMNKIPILVFSNLKNVVLTMLKSYI